MIALHCTVWIYLKLLHTFCTFIFFSSLTLNLHCGSWTLESVMNSNWTIVQKLTLFSSFLNHIPLNKNLARWGSKNYALCQIWFVMDHGFIDAEHVKCWWVRKSQTVAEQFLTERVLSFSCHVTNAYNAMYICIILLVLLHFSV